MHSAWLCDVGVYHFCRINDAVELGFADEPELQRGSLQREIVIHREVSMARALSG